MSGKNKAEDSQKQLAQQQLDQSKSMYEESLRRTARMDSLQSAPIKYAQDMASGDRSKLLQASAVPLGNINRAFDGTRANIYDSIPSGAGRDFALASAGRQKNSDTATALNQGFMQSLSTLMGAGTEAGSFGLQQQGAGLRAGEDAASGNKMLMDASAQRKAATMGFLGSIAGGAGSAAGGYLMKH